MGQFKAGNFVYQLIRPIDLSEQQKLMGATYDAHNACWLADIIFDTYVSHGLGRMPDSSRAFATNSQVYIDEESVFPFDILALGQLWLRVDQLKERCQREWSQGAASTG